MRKPTVSYEAYEEAVSDALRYREQSLRLKHQLDAIVRDHAEELRKLQTDNSHLMHWNAGLALENSELRFELDQIKGDA